MPNPLSEGGGDPPLGQPEGLAPISQARCRKRQCDGGPPEQTGQGDPHGMDPQPVEPIPTLEKMGKTPHRPLCHKVQQETPNIRVPSPGPGGLGRGCDGNPVVRHERLCLSPVQPDPVRAGEGPEGEPSPHPDNPNVGTIFRRASHSPPVPLNVENEDLVQPRSKIPHGNAKTLRLHTWRLQKYMQRSKLSEDSMRCIEAQQRPSTKRIYHNHWEDEDMVCQEQNQGPSQALLTPHSQLPSLSQSDQETLSSHPENQKICHSLRP